MSTAIKMAAIVVLSGLIATGGRADTLEEAKARLKAESQRIEKEFADERAEAYRLVRRDDPKLLQSIELLIGLQELVNADKSLDQARRRVLMVTLKYDLDKVKEIAAERRKVTQKNDQRILNDSMRKDIVKYGSVKREEDARGPSGVAGSIIEARGKGLDEARLAKLDKSDRFNRVLGSVDKSAIPDPRDYVLPKNWLELSERRSTKVKMTAKEKAILKSLESMVDVDFSKNTLDDVIDSLRKYLKVEIAVDKRALAEVGLSEESLVTLKMRASGRTVLKRILADLNLTYAIKDEAILVTSQERAKELMTTRTYYVGDIVSVVDIRLPAAVSQAIMIDNVNRLMTTIQQQVDPRSWRSPNSDGGGSITFDPLSMSIIVRQSSEFHFMMGR